MSERATFEELLEFANKVREAGGGNPLDALMPAVPEDPQQCLIAKNLNFNCHVMPLDVDGNAPWCMILLNKDLRDRIADAMGLERTTQKVMPMSVGISIYVAALQPDRIEVYAVVLPDRIGQVASDFDEWNRALVEDDYDETGEIVWTAEGTDEDIQDLRDFFPYVEASIRETYANGLINEKGELIL
jgi:hypothetical protein